MEMGKTSNRMIAALRDDKDLEGTIVDHSTILGSGPVGDDEDDRSSVAIVTLNGRSELTMIPFHTPGAVAEFCASLQAASDAIFGDGDMQPEVIVDCTEERSIHSAHQRKRSH